MLNENQLHSIKEKLIEAVSYLERAKDYQSHFNMKDSFQKITDFIDEEVSATKELLETILDTIENLIKEEDSNEN